MRCGEEVMDLGVKTRNVHLRIRRSFRKCILIVHKETKAADKVTEACNWSRRMWQQHWRELTEEWLQQ